MQHLCYDLSYPDLKYDNLELKRISKVCLTRLGSKKFVSKKPVV